MVLTDDAEGFRSISSVSSALEMWTFSSRRRGVGVGCDRSDSEEERVVRCLLEEDGAFAENDRVLGEEGRENMLRKLKRADIEVDESNR